MSILRYYVDMYDYDDKCYYDNASGYGDSYVSLWTIDLGIDSLHSGFEGVFTCWGCFRIACQADIGHVDRVGIDIKV